MEEVKLQVFGYGVDGRGRNRNEPVCKKWMIDRK